MDKNLFLSFLSGNLLSFCVVAVIVVAIFSKNQRVRWYIAFLLPLVAIIIPFIFPPESAENLLFPAVIGLSAMFLFLLYYPILIVVGIFSIVRYFRKKKDQIK